MMTQDPMRWGLALLVMSALCGCEQGGVDSSFPGGGSNMPQPQPQPQPLPQPYIPPVIQPNNTTPNNTTPNNTTPNNTSPNNTTPNNNPNPTGRAVGEPCEANEDCRGDGYCLTPDTAPDGYCITTGCTATGCEDERDLCVVFADDTASADFCIKGCGSREDCRPGYECLDLKGTGEFACWVNEMMGGNNTPGAGMDGSACASDNDCAGGLCILDADGWPGGYCSRGCQSDVECNGDAQGAACKEDPTTGGSLCLDRCDINSDCRADYLCVREGLNGGTCKPAQRIAPGDTLQNLPFQTTCLVPDRDGLIFFDYTISQGASSYNLVFHGRFDAIASNEAEFAYIDLFGIERPSGQDLTLGGGGIDFGDDLSLLLDGLPSLAITIPSNPSKRAQLMPGAHRAVIGTNADEVCFYSIEEFAPGDTIDLNIYLTDAMGLNANSAPSDPAFTLLMQTMQMRLSALGIYLGKVRLIDVPQAVAARYSAPTDAQIFGFAQEITSLPGHELDDALSLNIIFVPRFNTTIPFLGLSLGIGAPPGLHGTIMSATVASTEYLYQSGEDIHGDPVEGGIYMGMTLVHEIGHFLGLHHTSEVQFEKHDPLADTPQCSATQVAGANYTSCPDVSNAMFPYISHPSPTFTANQISVIKANTLTKSLTTEPSP